MGKRGGKKKGSENTSGQYTPMSIREEVSGRKQSNSLKSITKLQHLQNLAIWAGGEASIPSLSALFGRRFAATGEALAIPPDPSLFPCQRCETVLQPGFNCTIRVVKNRAKTCGRGKKPASTTQNNVVYKCHFCSYENLKRGSPKGHMKEICPPKPKQPSKPKQAKSAHKKQNTTSEQGTTNKLETETEITVETASPSSGKDTSSIAENPSTQSALKGLTLLDSKKRKRNKPKPKKPDEPEANSAMADSKKDKATSSKRRRKGWTTLRDIVENNEKERSKTFTKISVPFTL